MGRPCLWSCASAVAGEKSFCMKMEEWYRKNYVEEKMIKQQPEASTPLTYESEIVFKDKARLYEGKYFFIKLFDKIMYDSTRELKHREF